MHPMFIVSTLSVYRKYLIRIFPNNTVSLILSAILCDGYCYLITLRIQKLEQKEASCPRLESCSDN